jgi:hypothetical protein
VSGALVALLLLLVTAPLSFGGTPSPGPPPGSAPATAGCPAAGSFADTSLCWARAAAAGGGRPTVVTLTGPQQLAADDDVTALKDHVPTLRQWLTVVVPAKTETGSGGTVLLALAAHRVVAPDSVITRLTDAQRTRLTEIGGCATGSFCHALTGPGITRGSDLIADGSAQDANSSFFTAGPPSHPATSAPPAASTSSPPSGQSGGGSGWQWLAVPAAVVLAALVITLTLLIRGSGSSSEAPSRRRGPVPGKPRGQPPAESPAMAPADVEAPPEPVGMRAVVRTVLRPQGYVEVHGLLYRARWAGAEPPPGVGEPVTVVDQGTGVLTARPARRTDQRVGY